MPFYTGRKVWISSAVLIAIGLGAAMWSQSVMEPGKAGSSMQETEQPIVTDESHAVIAIDTKQGKAIPYGMRGVNNETSNKEAFINHPQMIDEVNRYGRLGFIRWPGGTNTDVFNWRTGLPDLEYGAFAFGPAGTVHGPHTTFQLARAKGGEQIEDYLELLRKTNTKAMITVNVMHQTPEQTGDLAKYLYDNGVPVVYFELGNEIMFFTASSGNNTAYFKTASDYLDKAKVHYDAIKANYPGAKAIISMANSNKPAMAKAFDSDVFSYPTPYWDGVTFHRFEGDGKTVEEAITSANDALDKLVPLIDSGYAAKFKDKGTPIYLGEHGVALGGILESTQYHGLYVAESLLRLSTHPNISYLAGYRLHNGIFNTTVTKDKSNPALQLEDAFQKGETVDPQSFQYESYYHASSADIRIVDGAINFSSVAWPAQISGGASVPKSGGSIPALFAASYKGDNGKNYVVITNKSSRSQEATVRVDGHTVRSPMVKSYTTSSDPAARNNPQKPNTVAIRSENTANPVVIPPYSVTRIEWQRSTDPAAPRESWLYSLLPADGSSVRMQWYRSENAAGYKIKYGTRPGSYTQTVDAGNVLSYTIKGLTAGQTYYFITTAYNAGGESAPSLEKELKLAKPTTPVIRQASPETSGNVIVEWQSVPGADGYKLMYGTAPGNYTNTVGAGNNAGMLVSGLDNDTKYYFAVASFNAIGASELSKPVEAVPRALLPLAPQNLTIASEAADSISLAWKPARTEVANQTFEDGSAAGFTYADGAWTVSKHPNPQRKVMGLTSSAAGGSAVAAVWSRMPGASYEGSAVIEWTDSRAEGQVGVAARYIDIDNHIRFVYDRKDKLYKLIKVVQGKEQLLGSKKVDNPLVRATMLITADGNNLYAKLNNEGTIIQANDESLPSGSFALYSTDSGIWVDAVRLYAPNTTDYTVYRSTNPYNGFEQVAAGLKQPAYTDSGLTAGSMYYYKVQAVNDSGKSRDYSNVVRKN